MATPSLRARGMNRGAWKMIVLASIGGTLEYYDFVIFGIFAREIGQAVFPSQDPLVSLMVAFTTFAIGYIARPVGGLVLGRLGDKFGRRGVFLAAIFVTSVATLGIGVVPTYVAESAGAAAPFACGVIYTFVTLGVALGTGISLIVSHVMSPAYAAVYGWRIAFIFGGISGLGSFLLRRSFEESPAFLELKRLSAASREPVGELVRTHPTQIVVGIAAQAATASFAGLFFAHMPAYLTAVAKYDAPTAVFAQTLAVLLHAVAILAIGWLADRYSPHQLLRVGAALMALGAYPFYAALSAHSANILVLMMLASIAGAFVNGTFAFVTADLFPTRIRFSGVALVQNISQTAFGGTAPLVATALIRNLQSPTAPALVVAVCGVMTFVSSLTFARYKGRAVGVPQFLGSLVP